MAQLVPNWDASFTTSTDIDADTITTSSTLSSESISLDLKTSVRISVEIAYGATANQGIYVYLLPAVDDTNYATVNDAQWSVEMPSATSVTRYFTFAVAGEQVDKFKILLENNTGATVTATLRYKYSTIDQV